MNQKDFFLPFNEKEKNRILIKKTVDLAKNGESLLKFKPLMGVLITHKDKIIYETYAKDDEDHPVIRALKQLKNQPPGKLEMYVNIEFPYEKDEKNNVLDLLLQNKISKIVFGILDDSLAESKKMVQRLNQKNIILDIGVSEADCQFINRKYIFHHTYDKPYLILNYYNSVPTRFLPICDEIVESYKKNNYKKEHAILLTAANVMKRNDQFIYDSNENKTPIRYVLDPENKIPYYHYVLTDDFYTVVINQEVYFEKIYQLFQKDKLMSVIIENENPLFGYFLKEDRWNEINFIGFEDNKDYFKKLNLKNEFDYIFKKRKKQQLYFSTCIKRRFYI